MAVRVGGSALPTICKRPIKETNDGKKQSKIYTIMKRNKEVQ